MMDWLHRRKITNTVIEDFNVYWGTNITFGECIVIPIHDAIGNISFNKYRRNPLHDAKPKYLYDKGSSIVLYGAHKIKNEKTVLVTEGEFDALVAWSANIPAVSSTGGSLSFQSEWADLFKDKEVTLCFDNDLAGAEGMVKALKYIPHAKVVLIPDRPGVKDISDYVANGGDLRALIDTGKHFASIEQVAEDRANRVSLWLSTTFHDAYIKEHSKPVYERKPRDPKITDKIERAKSYPIDELIEFKQNKTHCIFHNEKTPSMVYYPKTNTCYCFGCGKVADSIAVYRQINNCSFIEAIKKLQ